MLRSLVVVAGLLLVGCTTTPQPAQTFPFPSSSDTTFAAPDGRVWVLHKVTRTGDDTYRIIFTPEPAKPTGWSEMLQFQFQKSLPSAEEVRAIAAEVQEKDDKDFTFEILPGDSGYLMSHHSPRWSERGISKTVFRSDRAILISYQTRLKEDPDGRWEFWKQLVSKLPAEALRFTFEE